MTDLDSIAAPSSALVLTPEEQSMVWFLGSLVRIRLDGPASNGELAILEHRGERGYGSPVHRHQDDDETFFVLSGELRVESGGSSRTAGPGGVAFLPRGLTHGFVVTSTEARFLTLHTPAGFDAFTRAAGTLAEPGVTTRPAELTQPDPAELQALARHYNIDIIGPPPRP